MNRKLLRIVRVVVLIEVAYLVLFNLALNLPLTQTLVNKIKPEKFAVSWDRAWTWYPLRVHARGVSANGQTSSQQWQAEVASASASMSLLRLVTKTVHISGVDAGDVDFRLRPRPKPDKDYAAIKAFFPPIEGRDPESPATPRKKKEGRGWTVEVDDIRARGNHEVWVFQVRGAVEGELGASLSYTSRGGPFSVSDGVAEIVVDTLSINDEAAVQDGGSLSGRFGFAPFVPSENKGVKSLGFLSADVELDLPVDSLDFLDVYLLRFDGMEVDGEGIWRGRLNYDRGDLVTGTDMVVSASELILNAARYLVKGSGDITIAVGDDAPERLELGMTFGALEAFHAEDTRPLVTGEKLSLEVGGDNRILPDAQRETGTGRVAVRIPRMAVPDLAAYQYLLPERWAVTLNGGTGELAGEADMSPTDLVMDLRVVSDHADLTLKGARFVTSLDLGLRAAGGAAETASLDISGSYLKLFDAGLASAKEEVSPDWHASLLLPEGRLVIPVANQTGDEGFTSAMQTLKQQPVREVLATVDADLVAQLSVSDLGWINQLFRSPFELAVSGGGEADMRVVVRSGWLAEGTEVRVQPTDLKVRVLDYVAQGDGRIDISVQGGGDTPDMMLNASLDDGSLRRSGEETSVVEGVSLALAATAQDVKIGTEPTVTAVDLKIPSARVTDMSVYNQYFPEKLPLHLTGGEAALSADVHLEQASAGGYVRLETDGLTSRIDEQQLAAELAVDVNLAGGVPSNMEFDISGSSVRLDQVRVEGAAETFDETGWAARFDLDEGRVVWQRPLEFDVVATVSMRDSRPIVALFANHRGKHGWIEKLLTVEDIRGTAKLSAGSGNIRIPYAVVGSDKIDVGAKGLFDDASREGIFYARFRKLDGILKVRDEERDFDIFGAREKFDSYAPGQTDVFARGSEPAPADTVESEADEQ